MVKTICIVGNSPCIKGQGLGYAIDKFDYVCRINDWVVKGHEKDVGTKTTHWVSGCGRQIPSWSKNRDISDLELIVIFPPRILHTYITKKRELQAKRRCLKRWGYWQDREDNKIWEDYKDRQFFKTRENVKIVNLEEGRHIQKMTNVSYFSTGIATIAYFIKQGYEVVVTGFDFYQSSKTHYWGKKTKLSGRHSFIREKAKYEEWVGNRTITKLEDYDSENRTKSFIILGNGPSLRSVNFELFKTEAFSHFTVIGINRSYLAYPDHDIMVVQDVEPIVELIEQGYSDEQIDNMNIHTSSYFDGRINVMSRRSSYSKEEIDRLKFLRKEGIIKDLGPKAYSTVDPGSLELSISATIFKHKNSGFEGRFKFYLLGVDMRNYGDDNHFYGDDVKQTCRWKHEGSSPRQIARSYKALKDVHEKGILENHKAQVFTCDRLSSLNDFLPFVDLCSGKTINTSIEPPKGPDSNELVKINSGAVPTSLVKGRIAPTTILNPRAKARFKRKSDEK